MRVATATIVSTVLALGCSPRVEPKPPAEVRSTVERTSLALDDPGPIGATPRQVLDYVEAAQYGANAYDGTRDMDGGDLLVAHGPYGFTFDPDSATATATRVIDGDVTRVQRLDILVHTTIASADGQLRVSGMVYVGVEDLSPTGISFSSEDAAGGIAILTGELPAWATTTLERRFADSRCGRASREIEAWRKGRLGVRIAGAPPDPSMLLVGVLWDPEVTPECSGFEKLDAVTLIRAD